MSEENNELKVKKWNEAISPRVTQLRSWFSQSEWTEGVRPYLNFIIETKRDELERPGTLPNDQFLKGQISAFKELLSLPLFIEKQIEMSEKPKPQPSGGAGY